MNVFLIQFLAYQAAREEYCNYNRMFDLFLENMP